MKLLKLLFAFILSAGIAFGQGKNCGQTAFCNGNISADAQIVYVSLPQGTGTITVIVAGTFDATLAIEDTTDGVTWNASSGTGSTTSPGSWQYSAGSFVAWRVRSSVYASGTAAISINSTPGGGGGGSACAASGGQLLFTSSGTDCIGVPNSSVDPSTGDVTLGAGFTVDSAGGVSITDNSNNGLNFTENGIGPIQFNAFGGAGVYITFSSTTSVINIDLPSPGIELAGPASILDIDQTTPGVATLSTIFNAVGGYQANGVAGISATGSACTITAITDGIITAATCTP